MSENTNNDDLDSFQDAQESIDNQHLAPEQSENNTSSALDEQATNTSPSKKKKNKKKNKRKNQSNNNSQIDLSEPGSKADSVDNDGTTTSEIPQNPELSHEAEPDTNIKEEDEPVVSEPTEDIIPSENTELKSEDVVAEVDDAIEKKTGNDLNVEDSMEPVEETQSEPTKELEEVIPEPIGESSAKEEINMEVVVDDDEPAQADQSVEVSEPPISQSTDPLVETEELNKETTTLENKLKELEESTQDEPEPEFEVVNERVLQSPSPIVPIKASPPELPDRSIVAPPHLPARHSGVPATLNSPPELPKRDGPPELPKRHEHGDGLKQFKIKPTQNVADLPPPPLPPQLSAAQKAHHRSSVLPSWFSRSSSSINGPAASEKSVEIEENYDLLLSRLSENNEEYLAKDEVSREQINTSANTLRSNFAEKVSSLEKDIEGETTAEDSEIHKVDWPFWTQVVNDYVSVVKSDPSKLAKELSSGIPNQIRGIVWQLVANSNPAEFEQNFFDLESKESKFEKNINKDLSRTTFITDYGLSVESLFKIIKAYSILDSEVGYTQGMAFITVPLLMNMGELESFTLLHKLMFGYNIRSLYLPEMPGLHLKLYQFDRLLEDFLPNLHAHLLRQGVRSSMYASQWFLTFFAYKFPLEFVLRIFDIIITEGFESILKFAVALMQSNEAKLLTLNFDDLLEYLKESLFNAYLIHNDAKEDEDEEEDSVHGGVGGFFTKKKQTIAPIITVDSYDVNKFVDDATNVKVLPITLKRYEDEYQEIHRVEKERQEEVEELRLRNNQLRKEIRKIESSYTLLNREHVQIANEMINGRMRIATLEDENKDLKEQNHNLRERVRSYQTQENVPVPTDLEDDLKRTMDRNLEVMTKNQELEDQVSQLLQEIEDLKGKSESPEPPQPASPVHKQSHWTKKLFK